jgi:hypothetical protein
MKPLKLLAASAAIVIVCFTTAQAQMMGHNPPIPMTLEQFAKATPGQSVQIAVRIISIKRSTLYAELLQHETDTVSKATGKHVQLYFADGTPVVMGTAADITPGAVLYVYGVVTKPYNVDVKRAVVDTKFVKVE